MKPKSQLSKLKIVRLILYFYIFDIFSSNFFPSNDKWIKGIYNQVNNAINESRENSLSVQKPINKHIGVEIIIY